jgi:two-component system NarL family sensor kinase
MHIPLKAKILLLTLVPSVLLSLTISWLYQKQSRELSAQQVAIFEESLLSSRKAALKDKVDLGMKAITPILNDIGKGIKQPEAEQRIKEVFRSMLYGDDGYFFAYDLTGTNLVHPTQPYLEGQNIFDFQDDNGQFVIRDLLGIANNGGGFYRYQWRKPTIGDEEDKLSYVIIIPKLNWMMGTGLYVDDIVRDIDVMQAKVETNIRKSFLASTVLLIATLGTVILIVTLVNIHTTQWADQRLKELANRYVTFQVMQRRNFARELHDGINQLLVSVKLRLNIAHKIWGQAQSEEHLIKSVDHLNTAIQEVRRISHDLRPVALDDLGLEAAINGLLDDLEEQSQVTTRRRIRLPDQRLPDAIEMTLYRVVQEALTNTMKHASASRVSFNLSHSHNHVTLVIGDNGCGLSPDKQEPGIGLMNMRERIELMGGKITIKNRPGRRLQHPKGTLIRATLYLNPANQIPPPDEGA